MRMDTVEWLYRHILRGQIKYFVRDGLIYGLYNGETFMSAIASEVARYLVERK